jgi:hypothetical protein
MAIEGSLDLFQLPEILQLVAQQSKTGILTVQGETDIVAISFDHGRIVNVDSLNQTFEEALGEVLAGQGLVTPAAFEQVKAEHRPGENRLIDLLVGRGLIDKAEVLKALRLHMFRLLTDLLGWRAGDFKFYGGEEVAYEGGFKPISVDELLLRSVEELAGEGHPTIPDSRSIYEAAPGDRILQLRREDEPAPLAPGRNVWLTEVEKSLLDQLVAGYNVAALVKKTGLDEYKVRFTLHRLLELGLVRRRLTPVRPAPGAPMAEAVPEPVILEPLVAPPIARVVRPTAPTWGGAALGWVGLGVLLLLLVRWPTLLALPFPWQAEERERLEGQLLQGSRGRIDQAARTYHLLKGKFPAELTALVDLGLVAPRELLSPSGARLIWRLTEGGYELAAPGREGELVLANEAVAGDFLLDPNFLTEPPQSTAAPLVLLD